MIITHFTKAHYYEPIIQSGVLTKQVNQNMFIPRFVWLTEDKISKTGLPKIFQKEGNYVGFQFNSDDIGAVKWNVQKRKYQFNKNKRTECALLDQSAIEVFGDNPIDFWVCENEIDMKHCIGTVGLSDERKKEILRDGAELTMKKIMQQFSVKELLDSATVVTKETINKVREVA